MNNYYNHLAKMPALKAKNMPKGLEELARALVASGRFRVDAINKQNFVRWNRPYENINMMFSHREISDPNLLPRTTETIWKVFSRKYSGTKLTDKVNEELDRLRHDMQNNIDVDVEEEMVLARLIVQSAEPPVIMLIIAEGTEVFVSYSYSVGDMLDIQTWQEAGDSSGLQSTDGRSAAVFVSCGGNPLVKEHKLERPTDGFYAITRLVVIAGQELAHYSDIIRGSGGTRFSADLYHGRATEVSRRGRIKDMENVIYFSHKIDKIWLKKVAEIERGLKFYREHRKLSLKVLVNKIETIILQAGFILLCKINGYNFLKDFYKDEYMCSTISLMLSDMLFNLHPDADAYKRQDPVEEEMIMCIEALARVQQQANKWGREVTKVMYPHLYHLYYKEILPACIASYEKISGSRFPEIFRREY